jgi:putative ABC transport system permease protein
MLGRILSDSLVRRRRRKLLTLAAVALGVTVATAVGTVALDVGDKVSRELRSFGANIVVEPAADTLAVTVGGVDYRPAGAGAALEESDLVKLKRIFWSNNITAFAPYLSVPVEIRGRQAVLAGTWFDHAMPVGKSEVFHTGVVALHPAWKLEGAWPGGGEVVVGRRLARALRLDIGERAELRLVSSVIPARFDSAHRPEPVEGPAGSQTTSQGSPLPVFTGTGFAGTTPSSEKSVGWIVSGILETGGTEDEELFAPLGPVQELAGEVGKIRRVEVSALTKPEDAFARSDVTKLTAGEFDRWYCSPYAASIAYQIEQAIPGSEARPVYQVADTEGKILDRFGGLMAAVALAALVAAALAVASMMLATVLERQVEIGLFKSLGASDAQVAAIFLVEAGILGSAGGVLGYAAGSFAAWRLSQSIFGSPVGVHWLMLPAALALAVLVTLAGSAWPLGRGLKVSPAAVLRD